MVGDLVPFSLRTSVQGHTLPFRGSPATSIRRRRRHVRELTFAPKKASEKAQTGVSDGPGRWRLTRPWSTILQSSAEECQRVVSRWPSSARYQLTRDSPVVQAMTTEFDDQIRALLAEADRAAPDPPDLPRLVQAPIDWRRWAVIPAAAVLALVLGTTLVLRILGVDLGLGFAASDSGAEVESGSDSDIAETLAELNLACAELDDQLDDIDPGPTDDTAALRRLETMAEHLPVLAIAIDEAARSRAEDPTLGLLASSAGDLVEDTAIAAENGRQGAAARYDTLATDLVDLGQDLDEFGARTCADLP